MLIPSELIIGLICISEIINSDVKIVTTGEACHVCKINGEELDWRNSCKGGMYDYIGDHSSFIFLPVIKGVSSLSYVTFGSA